MPSLWMLFASFLFAAMGAGVKLASATFSTSELVMYRGLIGSIILFASLRAHGGTLRTLFPKEHIWRSVVGVSSLWLWFYTIGALPLATAATINYTAPIWLAVWMFILAWRHGDHHIEWPLIGAVAMSFVGVTLVLRPAVQMNQWLGAVAGLGSSVISAMAYMQVRRLGKMGEPEYRVVFYFSLTTAIAGFLGACFTPDAAGVRFHGFSAHTFLLILGIGLTGLVAQMAMTRAYRVGKVLVVANLQYTGIIFSSLWSVLLWGDRFDWHVWLGIVVILVSGIAATFYNNRGAAPSAPAIIPDPIRTET
jgi:drug/metabolite transporter (DMT)-like permease